MQILKKIHDFLFEFAIDGHLRLSFCLRLLAMLLYIWNITVIQIYFNWYYGARSAPLLALLEQEDG